MGSSMLKHEQTHNGGKKNEIIRNSEVLVNLGGRFGPLVTPSVNSVHP